MAPRTKKRQASVVSISSSPPAKFRVPIYISSDEDESLPAKKRAVTPKYGKRKDNLVIPSPTKVTEIVLVSKRSSYGPTISIDSKNILAANEQYELLRSWVDAGIEMVIREMAGDQWYGLFCFEAGKC